MIIPVGEGTVQVMMRIIKSPDGIINKEVLDKFSFVPMVEGRNN
jgi:protein-L-isoaspartate(D-aspartate) O-methyltransferase